MTVGRRQRLALTPEQIEEARALKATRSWPQLAKRYKATVNQLRYALDADRQRELGQERNQRYKRNRTRDHKAERAKTKAKALALGFRSVYEMKLVRTAQLDAEHSKRCAWCGGQVAHPSNERPAPAWSPQPVRLLQNP